MAGRNENVDEDHSFTLRLIVATGDLDCEIDACVLCLHFVCDGSGGEAGYEERDHDDMLCVVELLELCVSA